MGKYYVAGIPFDSENSLKHYGVKGMEWNKHKFGIDADDRYIKWLKNAGQNIGRFANNAAQNVAKGATTAAKTVGSAVNKGANFVTGNQDRQNAAAKRREERTYNERAANPVRSMGYASDTKTAHPSQWFDKDAGLTGRDYSQQIADQQRVYASKAAKANQEANEYEQRANNALIPTVQRVAGNVGNTVGQAAQNASNLYTGQPNADRAEAIDRQVQEYERMGDEMYDLGMNAQGNRYHKLAENLGRVADANQAKYDNAPRQRITDAVNNVGNAVSGAAQKAADVALWPATREGVANAAQNVGNAVGQAAQNVGEFITGRNANENLERLYAENIANGGNGMSPELTEARNRYNQTLPGMVEWAQDNLRENVAPVIEERVQNVGDAVSGAANKAAEGAKGFINSAGQWVSNAAQNVGSAASKAASDASKGASGFINSAGQWVSNAAGNVGKAAQDAGKAVSNAAKNVGNTVGQAAEQARGGIGGLFDRVGNAVGSAANAVGDWAGNAAKDVGNAVGGAANAVGDWAGQAAQDVGGAVQNAGNWIGDRAQDVGGAVSGAAQNVGRVLGSQDYRDAMADKSHNDYRSRWSNDNAPVFSLQTQRAADRAREANMNGDPSARELMDYSYQLGSEYRDFAQRQADAQRAYAGRAANAKAAADNTLTGRLVNAGNWIGDRAADVGNWAGQAAQGVGQFINGIETARLQPKIQAATQQMADNYIQYLQDHPENPASPRHAEWAQQQQTQLIEQLRNDPELRAYYEQYIRHSAIDEKPDGVSDAFWEKFTADGGTREEYERDWR